MIYRISIAKSAEKEFVDLPSFVQTRLQKKILSLETDPRPSGTKKLRDSQYYRLRVGDYRILYSIDDRQSQIVILTIAHRKDVYR